MWKKTASLTKWLETTIEQVPKFVIFFKISFLLKSIKPDFEKSRETLHTMSKALFNEREKLIQEVLVRVYGDEKVIEVRFQIFKIYLVTDWLINAKTQSDWTRMHPNQFEASSWSVIYNNLDLRLMKQN